MNKLFTKKLIIVYVATVILIGSSLGMYAYYQKYLDSFDDDVTDTISQQTANTDENEQPAVALPENANLDVPYAAQAPFSNWDVHEESCEEAALYMYREFLNKTGYPDGRIPDTTADLVYRDMKAWQVAHHGKELDLTMEDLGIFAAEYYGLSYKTAVANEQNIQRAVADGNPVIVPVMTHSLENNMYGPYTVYHVLLIKGYDTTGVITNDAGVGNGPNHHYDWNILFSAIDAQTPKMNQERVMLTLAR